MDTYEVKAWVTVRAVDERDAAIKAEALLDLLPTDTLGHVEIESEESVYYVSNDADAILADTLDTFRAERERDADALVRIVVTDDGEDRILAYDLHGNDAVEWRAEVADILYPGANATVSVYDTRDPENITLIHRTTVYNKETN